MITIELEGQEHYFHLGTRDILALSDKGEDPAKWLEDVKGENEAVKFFDLFSKIVQHSYGVVDGDGMFAHDPKATAKFMTSDEFDELALDLLEAPKRFVAFIEGVVPKAVLKRGMSHMPAADKKKWEDAKSHLEHLV